jgi:uncharacterized membrane protein
MYEQAMELCAAICHQRPESSLHLAGVQAPLCFRCLGIYISLAIALIAAVRVRRPVTTRAFGRMALAVAAAATLLAIDALWLQGVAWNNATRTLTGCLLGAALGGFLAQCLRVLATGAAPGTSTGTSTFENEKWTPSTPRRVRPGG